MWAANRESQIAHGFAASVVFEMCAIGRMEIIISQYIAESTTKQPYFAV